MENEGTQVYNSATNLIQHVFCFGSDKEKQTVRDIELVRFIFSKRLTEAFTEITESDLKKYPDVRGSKIDKINIFAQHLPPAKSSYTHRFWKSSSGMVTAVAGESIRILLDLASAVTLYINDALLLKNCLEKSGN